MSRTRGPFLLFLVNNAPKNNVSFPSRSCTISHPPCRAVRLVSYTEQDVGSLRQPSELALEARVVHVHRADPGYQATGPVGLSASRDWSRLDTKLSLILLQLRRSDNQYSTSRLEGLVHSVHPTHLVSPSLQTKGRIPPLNARIFQMLVVEPRFSATLPVVLSALHHRRENGCLSLSRVGLRIGQNCTNWRQCTVIILTCLSLVSCGWRAMESVKEYRQTYDA